MYQAQASDFPFVSELPRAEKKRVTTLWQTLRHLSSIVQNDGMFLSQAVVAKVLGISPQRVFTLVSEGRFQTVDVFGVPHITEKSLIEFAKIERKNGRPPNVATTLKESMKRAASK